MVILSKGAGAKRALLRRGGTPGETRTHYLALRRRTLYPGELRRHDGIILTYAARIVNTGRIYVFSEFFVTHTPRLLTLRAKKPIIALLYILYGRSAECSN